MPCGRTLRAPEETAIKMTARDEETKGILDSIRDPVKEVARAWVEDLIAEMRNAPQRSATRQQVP